MAISTIDGGNGDGKSGASLVQIAGLGAPPSAKSEAAESKGSLKAEGEVARIVQLEETVVNRIAAGEVVVRPANALKELIENCLDAGSKHVLVALKAGGMKMLRIEDDGHGVREEDLPILCERFTTSKLRKYEDLTSIGTFGFRGEALASISHVAHVTVTTMTARDTMARVAQYTDGRLRAPPRPCAGTRGTTIVVEDLFYNNATRRQALGKDSIEHAKSLEVVQKYAIHYPKVSFTCRKATGAVAELHTAGGPEATSRHVVSAVQGSALAGQLFDFQVKSEEPKFSCHGLATGPQWTARNMSMTLFINNRLVECASLKRAVEAVFSPVLPRHQHPWIYLALDLDPTTVDVNVHPTKSNVQFLYEETISQKIQETLSVRLKEQAGSRTFGAQTSLLASTVASSQRQQVLPTAKPAPAPAMSVAAEGGTSIVAATSSSIAATTSAPISLDSLGAFAATDSLASDSLTSSGPALAETQPSQQLSQKGPKRVELNPVRVRTDHRQRSLESIWRDTKAGGAVAAPPPPAEAAAAANPEAAPPPPPPPPPAVGDGGAGGSGRASTGSAMCAAPAPSGHGAASKAPFQEDEARRHEAFQEAQQLTSVCELKAGVALACHDQEFSDGLNRSVYVGPISRELVLVQCGSSLCMANLCILAREFAYQRLLRLFGGVGRIALRAPLPLRELLRLGILDPGSGFDPAVHADVDVGCLVEQFAELLEEKAEMLHEYLMMDIADGKLWSLPNALGVTSDAGLKFDELPLFLIRLCAEIDWEEEKPCFESLCRAAADFAVELLLPGQEEAQKAVAQSVGPAAASGAADAAALNAAVEAGEFPDVATAAAARVKRLRTQGPGALQELRFLHEAIRHDAAAAGSAGACRWPAAFKKDGTVVKLVALEQLYRIFERC